ncbi:hypothetical protein [Streptomyces sp. CC208A]|nr:hypothetical protein [Streptomyces sp. CC208A]
MVTCSTTVDAATPGARSSTYVADGTVKIDQRRVNAAHAVRGGRT